MVDDPTAQISTSGPAHEDTVKQAKKNPKQPNQGSEKRIKELEDELHTAKNQIMHAYADYQNLVRRTRIEKEEWTRAAGKDILLPILPVLDTLRRAQISAKAADTEGLRQGIDLAVKEFTKALETIGVTPIVSVGQPFNPEKMESVDTLDGEPENHVAEEVLTGYDYQGKLLRPAKVRVYKKGKQ
jgi:molecular chaperone GrpE